MIIAQLILSIITLIVQFNLDLAIHLHNEVNCIHYVVQFFDYIINTDI